MKHETEASNRPSAGDSGKQLLASRDAKKRGEMAEMAFMYKACGLGFGVAKPYGDSERYDFIVSSGKRFWRVQVKSTYLPRRTGYRVIAEGSRLRRNTVYTPEEIDFLVAYLVPVDAWYVVPVEALETKALFLYPEGCRFGGRYEKYREAWHLLMEKP